MSAFGATLFLIPNLLDSSGDPEIELPAPALAAIRRLEHFVVEGDKAAWRLLSRVRGQAGLDRVKLERLDEHTAPAEIPKLLSPLKGGEDMGLLSEAGMPCIADPGSALVALAHAEGFRVVPLTGPSSILLALCASGFDGQHFSFLGYLPVDAHSRKTALRELERGVARDGATRIFIETPYRNARLFEDCLAVLDPNSRLCIAASLCSPTERIRQDIISNWMAKPWKILKEPSIFLIGREMSSTSQKPRLDPRPKLGQNKEQWQNRRR